MIDGALPGLSFFMILTLFLCSWLVEKI